MPVKQRYTKEDCHEGQDPTTCHPGGGSGGSGGVKKEQKPSRIAAMVAGKQAHAKSEAADDLASKGVPHMTVAAAYREAAQAHERAIKLLKSKALDHDDHKAAAKHAEAKMNEHIASAVDEGYFSTFSKAPVGYGPDPYSGQTRAKGWST